MEEEGSRACELCSSPARLYCISDAAFLCFHCDSYVHQANFLVARHSRELLCPRCLSFAGCSFSGVGLRPYPPLCRSCSSESPADSSDSDSSSLTCVSASGSFTADFHRCEGQSSSAVSEAGKSDGMRRRARPVDARVERVLESWCRQLGSSSRRCLSSLALHALEAWRSDKCAGLSLRVRLAASLWFALNACGLRGGTRAELKKLEGCSGVPASVIAVAETRLRKVTMIKIKKLKNDEEEGWAEC